MPQFKIVSYNINNSIRTKQVIDNISNFAAMGVSVFCLQEVRPHESEDQFIGDLILNTLGPRWKGEFFLGINPKSFDYGLALIWNLEVLQPTKFEKIFFPMLNKMRLYEQALEFVKVKDIRLTQRGALIGAFSYAGSQLRINNVHLDWQGGSEHRFSQFEYLIKYLDAEMPPVEYEIICGDFNTLGIRDNSKELNRIQALLGEKFISSFPKFTRTTTHFQHLDHIFARNLKISQGKVFRLPGSDHYPIMTTLSC